MNRSIIFIVIIYIFTTPPGVLAQLDIYGQVSPSFAQTSEVTSQLILNEGRPTFLWRLDVLADAYITENVTAYFNFRSEQDQTVNIDYLAIRITGILPLGLNIQAGKFDIPFGNLYSRRFPADNFLFDLPLMYHYHTVLMSDYLYPNAGTLFYNRGNGGTPALPSSMPVLDRGMYGTGVMLFGSVGIVDYFAMLMDGTVSNTGSYGHSMNINRDFGKVFRLTVTPLFGLTIGASYSWGSYLSDSIAGYYTNFTKAEDYRQYTGGVDIEYSRGHVQFFSHAVYNRWEYPTISDNLDVLGYYAEIKYTVLPRWYIAGRINQLIFSQIEAYESKEGWDHDVFQIEAGIGYAVDRNTLVKAVFKETSIHGITKESNSMIALQLVASF